MSIIVRIPTPLRKLTNDQDVVSGSGETLVQCIDGLDAQYPGLKDRLLDETGELRRFVNIYINGEDVRFTQGVQTQLKSGDEISIVPAVAGGAEEPRTEPRLKYYRASPGAYQALKALQDYIEAYGLERSLLELVKLRASQLNGAFCFDMHWKDARAIGESEERLDRPAIEELFAYIEWTWRQYEATIRPLGDDALVKPVPGSGWPDLRDALAHVNWGYDRWLTDPSRTSEIPIESVNSWSDAEAYRERVRGRLREYLDSLNDDELARAREINIDGGMMSHAPADILSLLLLHEREHHGDLNTLLYQMGVEPVQTSFRFFLVDTGRRGRV